MIEKFTGCIISQSLQLSMQQLLLWFQQHCKWLTTAFSSHKPTSQIVKFSEKQNKSEDSDCLHVCVEDPFLAGYRFVQGDPADTTAFCWCYEPVKDKNQHHTCYFKCIKRRQRTEVQKDTAPLEWDGNSKCILFPARERENRKWHPSSTWWIGSRRLRLKVYSTGTQNICVWHRFKQIN